MYAELWRYLQDFREWRRVAIQQAVDRTCRRIVTWSNEGVSMEEKKHRAEAEVERDVQLLFSDGYHSGWRFFGV
jgi:hypothetical protein